MNATASNTLTDRIGWWLECLCKAIADQGCRLRVPGPLVVAIWTRVRRLGARLDAFIVRYRAGTLKPPRPHVAAKRSEPAPRAQRAPGLLPRARNWLRRIIPTPQVGQFTGGLWWLLIDPEMAEIIANAPQIGRILRPLCHILGTPLPDQLKLPKRARVRKKKEPLPPHPLAARFPDTPPARAAARALARMQAGLPVNVKRMSAVALGYFLHPPRDDNCPPPEIGYGGRSFPPLPKDYKRPEWD